MKAIFTVLILFCLSNTVTRGQEIKIKEPVRFLALGDSYTIGEGVSETNRWPVQFTERLQEWGYVVAETEIRARTGWTTGNLLNSLEDEKPGFDPNLVSLLIGVNNQYQGRSQDDYAEEFEGLLKKALEFVEEDSTAVFVLSIPDYAYTPFGGGSTSISEEIDEFNDINRSISYSYGVNYINITDISRRGLQYPDYVTVDGLHPSGLQYELWVDRIINLVELKTSTQNPEFMTSKVSVYPNPVDDSMIIESVSSVRGLELELSDLSGRLIMEEFYPGNQVEINMGFLNAGFYLLKVSTRASESSDHIFRLVKK